MSDRLLWTTLDVFILDWISSSYSRPAHPDLRFNLTHGEAFDIDVTFQIKPAVGLPAPLGPRDQPFPVTQKCPQTNQRIHQSMYG